ncbi:hypothetical protein AB0K09_21275 [Streptomyces sp. NPDC049577]|uniref:DUF7144 family membrane protein n=1 Tax=Streptomyces sp. NPDC049577 TaxID=3155153 RepID=UPI00342748BD
MSTSHAHHQSGAGQAAATGLVLFSAVFLMITGILDFFRGLMGITHDRVFVTTPNYVFKFDLTSWGWIHLILGILSIIVAMGLFSGALWARVLAIVLAGLLILANFLSIPYYPLWSLVVIALGALVIWGLCTVRRDYAGPSYRG